MPDLMGGYIASLRPSSGHRSMYLTIIAFTEKKVETRLHARAHARQTNLLISCRQDRSLS